MMRDEIAFDLETEAPRGAAMVARYEVGERDAIFAEIEVEGARRWFLISDAAPIEMSPWRDRRVPLGGALTPAERARVKVLAYRPERRLVLGVERGGRPCVEKGYRPRRLERAARAHRCAAMALAESPLRSVPLYEERPRTASLVFGMVEGRRPELDAGAAATLGVLGRGLRVLQEAPTPWETPPFSAADEVAVVERWRQRSLRVQGALPAGWEQQWSRCVRAIESVPPVATGLAHRDLHDRQLLLEGDALTLLDFDLLCRAEVALDPGNLIAHLQLRRLQGVPGLDHFAFDRLRGAFLDGLDRTASPGFAPRLACYEASSLLRLALVYFLRPRWKALASELVVRAELRLESCS